MKFGPQTIKSWLPYTHETIVGQQANTNITVDDGWHLSSGTSLPSIKEISESIHHCQAQKTGGHKPCCDVVILNENSRPGIFFFSSSAAPRPAAVITQPNPLGGLSRLKSRKIVQLSGLRTGEGGGVVGMREQKGCWDAMLLFIRRRRMPLNTSG